MYDSMNLINLHNLHNLELKLKNFLEVFYKNRNFTYLHRVFSLVPASFSFPISFSSFLFYSFTMVFVMFILSLFSSISIISL